MGEEELKFDMEPESPENPSGNGQGMSKILVIAGVIALISGATGTFMALAVKSDLAELRKEINLQPNPSLKVQAEMDAIREELASVDEKLAKSNAQLGSIVSQTQRAFENIMREIKANREEVNKSGSLSGEMGKRIAALENARQKKTNPVSREKIGERPALAGKPEDGYHIIEPGDNFDKLAKHYGSTIEAFLRSNPGVDPRRLQIGQQIKIPE